MCVCVYVSECVSVHDSVCVRACVCVSAQKADILFSHKLQETHPNVHLLSLKKIFTIVSIYDECI